MTVFKRKIIPKNIPGRVLPKAKSKMMTQKIIPLTKTKKLRKIIGPTLGNTRL